MDYTVINECKLGRVFDKDVKKNGEVVGSKKMVEVVTWGEKVEIEVDPSYSKELKIGIVGRATIQGAIVSKSEVRTWGTGDKARTYAADSTFFRFERLGGFEPSK